MSRNFTISDLERHFLTRVDQGVSYENILTEFASFMKGKFIRFKYRYPDSYGVLVNKDVWINIFYSPQKDVFGFQTFQLNGNLQSVLSLQHSDSSIVDLILRLATNIGSFKALDDDVENSDDSCDYDDSGDDSDSY